MEGRPTLEDFLDGKTIRYRGNKASNGIYQAQIDKGLIRVINYLPNGAMRIITFSTNVFKSTDFYNSVEIVIYGDSDEIPDSDSMCDYDSIANGLG